MQSGWAELSAVTKISQHAYDWPNGVHLSDHLPHSWWQRLSSVWALIDPGWPKSRINTRSHHYPGRRRNQHRLCIRSWRFHREWIESFPFIFHGPEQVTCPHLISKRVGSTTLYVPEGKEKRVYLERCDDHHRALYLSRQLSLPLFETTLLKCIWSTQVMIFGIGVSLCLCHWDVTTVGLFSGDIFYDSILSSLLLIRNTFLEGYLSGYFRVHGTGFSLVTVHLRVPCHFMQSIRTWYRVWMESNSICPFVTGFFHLT